MGRSYAVPPSNAKIGIVGAGLAGLSCGYDLKKHGISADAKGKIKAHLEHWFSNPLTKCSYAGYQPSQFTTIANNEGKPIGNSILQENIPVLFMSGKVTWKVLLQVFRQQTKILQDIKVSKL